MDGAINTIRKGDCIEGLNVLPEGSAGLVFADPPFNIGYDYDVYQDSLESQQYVHWSRDWMSAVYRVLKSDGTFWLAIGDEFAAELKVECQNIGFHCRSWVIWYYTFGVNCSKKFSRSHAHLFYFVKNPSQFTFRDDDLDNRIPSARQLVYNDKRANPRGRLPDDTWIIRPANVVGELTDDDGLWRPGQLPAPSDDTQTWTLRPQDLAECFQSSEDTWFFPRVAGTFKERSGFHGCQMPEQLLGRIIRTCSNPGDLVVDPFSGSATTLAVAKKLGRPYLGFDISADYVRHGQQRLDSIRVGDRLEGSAEPTVSTPATGRSHTKSRSHVKRSKSPDAARTREQHYDDIQLALTLGGICEAFRRTHEGFSADRVVADPALNEQFADACRKLGIVGDPRTWNILLFRLRKSGRLSHLKTTRRTTFSWEDCDRYLFAGEIALQTMLDKGNAASLDDILCDPSLASEFDQIARQFAPGRTSLDYRWAALKLRKQAKTARSRGAVLVPPSRLGKVIPLEELRHQLPQIPKQPGVCIVSSNRSHKLYVGESLNLRSRLSAQFAKQTSRKAWAAFSTSLRIQFFLTQTVPAQMLAWQSCLVRKYKPRLNFHELRSTT